MKAYPSSGNIFLPDEGNRVAESGFASSRSVRQWPVYVEGGNVLEICGSDFW